MIKNKSNFLFILGLLLANSMFGQELLSLEKCRQLAMENNKVLLIAKENMEIANQLKKAAFTQFLPNFSANGSYVWNQKNLSLLEEDAHLPVGKVMADGSFVPIDVNGVPFNPHENPEKLQYALLPKSELEYDVQNIFVGSIAFVQPLYMGGKIRELNKLAKYGGNVAQIQMESATTEILLEVDEAYWRVVSLEAKVELVNQYHKLISQIDTQTGYLLEQGLATRADQLKVKVKLNEAELSMTRATDGLNLSRMALNQLCGLELEHKYRLADMDALDFTPSIKEVPVEQALSSRTEIRVLEQLQHIANSNTKLAHSRFLPNVAMTGGYLVSNPNTYNGFSNSFAGMMNFGVVVNVPIFHFGERIHTLRTSKAQSRIVGIQIEEAREKIELQITQSSYRVRESLKRQQATLKNTENAEENLRVANEGFTEGVISSTDVLGAQSAWLSAKSDNIDSNIDVRLCILYLEKAQGETLMKTK